MIYYPDSLLEGVAYAEQGAPYVKIWGVLRKHLGDNAMTTQSDREMPKNYGSYNYNDWYDIEMIRLIASTFRDINSALKDNKQYKDALQKAYEIFKDYRSSDDFIKRVESIRLLDNTGKQVSEDSKGNPVRGFDRVRGYIDRGYKRTASDLSSFNDDAGFSAISKNPEEIYKYAEGKERIFKYKMNGKSVLAMFELLDRLTLLKYAEGTNGVDNLINKISTCDMEDNGTFPQIPKIPPMDFVKGKDGKETTDKDGLRVPKTSIMEYMLKMNSIRSMEVLKKDLAKLYTSADDKKLLDAIFNYMEEYRAKVDEGASVQELRELANQFTATTGLAPASAARVLLRVNERSGGFYANIPLSVFDLSNDTAAAKLKAATKGNSLTAHLIRARIIWAYIFGDPSKNVKSKNYTDNKAYAQEIIKDIQVNNRMISHYIDELIHQSHVLFVKDDPKSQIEDDYDPGIPRKPQRRKNVVATAPTPDYDLEED